MSLHLGSAGGGGGGTGDVTTEQLDAALALRAPVSFTWLPATDYTAGQLVTHGGQAFTAKADFTSGAAFDAANWNVVAPGLLASASITADVSFATNATYQQVAALQVTPEQVDRPVLIEITGMAISHTAAQPSASFHLIIDDITAGTHIGAGTIDYPTAGRWSNAPRVRALVPAGTASHTYSAVIFAATAGTVTLRTSGGMGHLMTATQV